MYFILDQQIWSIRNGRGVDFKNISLIYYTVTYMMSRHHNSQLYLRSLSACKYNGHLHMFQLNSLRCTSQTSKNEFPWISCWNNVVCDSGKAQSICSILVNGQNQQVIKPFLGLVELKYVVHNKKLFSL